MPSAAASPARALPLQLEVCVTDYRKAVADARQLFQNMADEVLSERPAPRSWSAIECIVHLNLCNQAMLPGLRQAVESAPPVAEDANRDYRMDLLGRFLAWSLEPPPQIKMKTSVSAEPLDVKSPRDVLEEFDLQHQLFLGLLKMSAGRAIDRQKMKSPFANIHYNAYSAFRIIAAHDRRHLWQARHALPPQVQVVRLSE